MGDKAIIDSNILIYAFDAFDAQKYNKANRFLHSAMNGSGVFLSAQNLAEFYVNITKGNKKVKKGLSKEYSKQVVEDLARVFPILYYNEKTVFDAISIEMDYKVPFWDALLAATMRENGLKIIYTEDKDFDKIGWITALNPLK